MLSSHGRLASFFRFGSFFYILFEMGNVGAKSFTGLAAEMKGSESIMVKKKHGSCNTPPMTNLRWRCDHKTADKICCFNRHYAEHSGYWLTTSFLQEESAASGEITFYDSVSGKPLFIAPRGRSWDAFVKESKSHGWPSFRDSEVIKENVRILSDGEAVSVDGTHLGHNLPDRSGNRYCINIVSVAGVKDGMQNADDL